MFFYPTYNFFLLELIKNKFRIRYCLVYCNS